MPEYALPEPHDVECLVDVDGVFSKFSEKAFAELPEITGQHFRIEDMQTWDMFDMIPREYEAACYERWKTPGWCLSLEAYEGSREVVKKLEELTHLYFVTSPVNGPNWVYERGLWVRETLESRRHVISTEAKWQVAGDLLVDDKPANLYSWLKRHPLGFAVLWAQPYNRFAELHPRMVRTSSWDDVYALIEKIKFNKMWRRS